MTDSSQCLFDKDAGTVGSQSNLIYNQDPTSPNTYKLTASNPGQFYYNIFYHATTTSLTITIPAPSVTQGATPVHWYDGVTKVGDCYINGNELGSSKTLITGYNGGALRVNVPAGETYFITIHLDYGLKGTKGWAKGVTPTPTTTAANTTYGKIVNYKELHLQRFRRHPLQYGPEHQRLQEESWHRRNELGQQHSESHG